MNQDKLVRLLFLSFGLQILHYVTIGVIAYNGYLLYTYQPPQHLNIFFYGALVIVIGTILNIIISFIMTIHLDKDKYSGREELLKQYDIDSKFQSLRETLFSESSDGRSHCVERLEDMSYRMVREMCETEEQLRTETTTKIFLNRANGVLTALLVVAVSYILITQVF